jgi:hypothetical protein
VLRIASMGKRKTRIGRMVNVDLLPKWTVVVTENGEPVHRETSTDSNDALRRARQWAEDNVQFHPLAIVGRPELARSGS